MSLVSEVEVVEADAMLNSGQVRRTERGGSQRLVGHLLATNLRLSAATRYPRSPSTMAAPTSTARSPATAARAMGGDRRHRGGTIRGQGR